MTGRSGKIATIGTSAGQPCLQSVHEIRTSGESLALADDQWDTGLIDRLPVAAETCRWITSASVPTHWIECHTVPTHSGKKAGANEGGGTVAGDSASDPNLTSVSWTTRPEAPAKTMVCGHQAKLIQYASSMNARGYEVARLLPRSIAVQSAAKSLLEIDCVASIVIEDDGIELVVNQNDQVGLIRNYPSAKYAIETSEDRTSSVDSASSNRREIASRIDQAIHYAAREDRSIYDKKRPILIAGSGALDSGWDRTLARHLNRPVATWRSQLEIHGKPVVLDASYAVAVSLAWSAYAEDQQAVSPNAGVAKSHRSDQ